MVGLFVSAVSVLALAGLWILVGAVSRVADALEAANRHYGIGDEDGEPEPVPEEDIVERAGR